MSRLLLQPAVWPVLALNPCPSMDPDDPVRWYLELFGPSKAENLTGCQATEKPKTNGSNAFKNVTGSRPASCMHQPCRRR